MTIESADAENVILGERTRELLRAFADFVNMVSVDAPSPVLARQMVELERLAREIDTLAGTGLHESGAWSTLVEPTRIMRLYEVLQHRQAQPPIVE